MKEPIHVNERFLVGRDQPEAKDLSGLARRGIRSVINLRTTGEQGETMSPAKEGEQVREAGMDYAHVPVSHGAMDRDCFERFQTEAALLPSPIFVHCASGKRAGTFMAMIVGMAQGSPEGEKIDELLGMSSESDATAARNFLQDYIEASAR